jgi:phage gpG-like protein
VATATVRIYEDQLRRLTRDPAGPIGRDLARRAVRVESAAKQACPVDTGRLRMSITWALGSDEAGVYADVGTNVEYALHVEYGTRHMAARPYLRPALAAAK